MDSSCDGSLDNSQIVLSPEAVELGYTSDSSRATWGERTCRSISWQVRSRDPGKAICPGWCKHPRIGFYRKDSHPIGKMKDFVQRRDFVPARGSDPEGEIFEVWVKEPA